MTTYKEGEKIQFKIKNLIELAENEEYYVLEDLSGQKQLLNASYYKNYQFKIGQNIICKVDHINCSGKIFLEPEHPFYKENEVYEFVIDTVEKSENRLKEIVYHLNSTDKTGNTATCITENISDNIKSGQKIKYKIERIKKGKLYLGIVNEISVNDLISGVYYKFKIEDIRILKDTFKYYILSDKKNRKHLLRHEFYTHHHLSIGQIIECTVIKFSSAGYPVLEPKHPVYKIGKTYKFEFVKQEKDFKGEITGNYTITVKDVFGEKVQFMSSEKLSVQKIKSGKIQCKVTGIKKGKPLLVVI
ncbi:MAG: hypothetical protein DRI94_09815 [Bacteroidetes bacterium]|nr:MAG: hypothetical protein DRI94_09815 [Bacteroidota bacterium]